MKNSVTISKNKPSGAWRNRIAGEGVEHPEQLLANPRNWRIHPKPQQDALCGVLEEVGWVQRVIVNKRTGFVLDGHMRVELAISKGEKWVPVLYVDLTEKEEAKVLATFDPISGMAGIDDEKLAGLVKEIEAATPAVQDLVAALCASAPEFDEPPQSVKDNADKLKEIHDQRREGNVAVAKERDTEIYAVIVFQSRSDRARCMKSLGLPEDERYIAAESVLITNKGAAKTSGTHAAKSIKRAQPADVSHIESGLSLLRIVRQETDAIGCAVSFGKDSLATLDLCCRIFDRVEGFYLYRVAGLGACRNGQAK